MATLTLNRPEKKNSLSPELVNILSQTLAELSADDAIRAVVIRGAGDKGKPGISRGIRAVYYGNAAAES